ncbi:LysM peptidoglycan-binding domain-containing protein [Prosthecobacter sp.]|uniref:LysM peptidoglycan-binding domain-containing protein n=1 Tax=Prosthecobacter sp. TaxID=1965333 RepID=UPI001D89CC2F|nr:LysM peptidoglycan-binding domain-containing protein [Prosthecobacter sp.]MCB1277156.1 LysM peptidoglycan-binding domain-containing protein [Prosthecobacter sp.]
MTLPLSAQVSYTYTAPPPPGYPASGAPKQSSSKATRQSAAAVQAPATYPGYPSTYPPPPGYTYPPPPPGYGTSTRAPTTKPSTTGKSSSKTTSSKKSTAGPPPPPKVYGPTGDLSSQVSKLRESDKVQNLRLGELERDVSSIKRGGKSGVRYDGGTDIAARTTYVARPGDTLWRIASTHRVSVGEIQQLNRMTEEEVHVGQTLLIPSPHRLSSSTTQVSYSPSTPGGSSAPVSSSSYYTIKKGDSLKAIAIKHKMTTAALASANGIKDANKIFVGQKLKIPGRSGSNVASSKPQSPPSESSDTVPLPNYGVPATTPPPPASGMAPAPAAPQATAPVAPKAPSTADSHRGILAYRVDLSDNIESIASQFSTTPDRIREMNRLSPDTPLKPGDEIMVPAMGAVSVSSR